MPVKAIYSAFGRALYHIDCPAPSFDRSMEILNYMLGNVVPGNGNNILLDAASAVVVTDLTRSQRCLMTQPAGRGGGLVGSKSTTVLDDLYSSGGSNNSV